MKETGLKTAGRAGLQPNEHPKLWKGPVPEKGRLFWTTAFGLASELFCCLNLPWASSGTNLLFQRVTLKWPQAQPFHFLCGNKKKAQWHFEPAGRFLFSRAALSLSLVLILCLHPRALHGSMTSTKVWSLSPWLSSEAGKPRQARTKCLFPQWEGKAERKIPGGRQGEIFAEQQPAKTYHLQSWLCPLRTHPSDCLGDSHNRDRAGSWLQVRLSNSQQVSEPRKQEFQFLFFFSLWATEKTSSLRFRATQ